MAGSSVGASNVRAVLESVPVLQFSVDEARRCAELRVSLRSRGKRIRPRALDLITAAIALENGLTLVTRNTHDFDDIPGLLLYSWTAPP